MKKLSSLLIFAFFAQLLFAQNNHEQFNLSKYLEKANLNHEIYDEFRAMRTEKDIFQGSGGILLDSLYYINSLDTSAYYYFSGTANYDANDRLIELLWKEIDGVSNTLSDYKRVEYSYTPTGKPDTINYYFSFGNGWIKEKSVECYYNQYDTLIQQKRFILTPSGYKLELNLNYIYDSLSRLIEYNSVHWTYGSNTSKIALKSLYSYNSNNQVLTDSGFILFDTLWEGFFAQVFTYNAANQIESNVLSSCNSGIWTEDWKLFNSYNNSNLVDTSWDFRKIQSNWENTQISYYLYTPTNQISQRTTYAKINSGVFMPDIKQINKYDSFDRWIKTSTFEYDTTTNLWINSYGNGVVLDAAGNILQSYTCYWNSGVWDSLVYMSSVFDINVNASNLNFPIIDNPEKTSVPEWDINSNSLLTERAYFELDFFSNTVQMTDYVKFYYSGYPNGFNSKEKTKFINVYPNPASDYLTFDMDSELANGMITIYNLLGEKILQQDFSLELQKKIDISKLETGIYFYKITSSAENIKSGKFTKL